MGKRYYCDFCEKSFADNPTNRKNHLKSVIHARNRKVHYDLFRDAVTILSEEATKKPCRKFFSQGSCDIGDGCRYSHMTAERRQQLEKQAEEKLLADKKFAEEEENTPSVDEWLSKRSKKIKKEEKTDEPESEEFVYELPPHVAAIPNLPPSLLPPPPDMLKNLHRIEEWG